MTIKKVTVDAVLFDMDGTLIDSTPGVLATWAIFADEYGLNAEKVAHATHGRRLYDTLGEYCNIKDEQKLIEEVNRFEDEIVKHGPVPLPGAHKLLEQIMSGNPSEEAQKHAWTIVTSASNGYAPRALKACGIALPPERTITSNDVKQGKPHPDPYLAGAKLCGVDPRNCLVVEDAPSGIQAGAAAGAKTLAVCTSHSNVAILSESKPDFLVKDLTKVSAKWVDGKLEITMNGSED